MWIGGGSIILAGITIGTGSVIGAGSVVTKSIPANCVAVGNPCKVIRYLKSDNKIQTIKSFKLRNWNRADVPALARHLNNKKFGTIAVMPFLIPILRMTPNNSSVLLKDKANRTITALR